MGDLHISQGHGVTMERNEMNESIANKKEKERKRKAVPILSVLDLPVELLSKVLGNLTDGKDIVNVHLVNSKFNECASWDGITGICFNVHQHRFSPCQKLSMCSATAEFVFGPHYLQDGILRSFWKNCGKLEEITIRSLGWWDSTDVHPLLSEIRSLHQEMPRKIKSLTNHCPDTAGSTGLLEMWQDSLRRIYLRWGGWECRVGTNGLEEVGTNEIDSTISALGPCAELREATFAYRSKLLTLLDAVRNKRYLKVLEPRSVRSDEECSKGRFKYYVISKVQPLS